MVYITVMQSPAYHQMTLEEFLFGDTTVKPYENQNLTNTRTYESFFVSDRLKRRLGIEPFELIQKLTEFNNSAEHLRQVPRHSLYREFHIPKKSGGLRKIDAPNDELMDKLRELKRIFENDFKALYHTSAFAYIKKRGILDALKRHQSNESRWYAKFDLHNFFGSTTLEFIMKMFSMVYPFSEVIAHPDGKAELEKALELAILDGGLPQGTPISPLITNIMMIPVDFMISKRLRGFEDRKYVYTRYADDFQISARKHFDYHEVEHLIEEVLGEFGAPFALNTKKTRYGSTAGRNWNLGLMINKDNQITVGHEKKRHFKAMLTSYILDRGNGISWDLSDIQVMEGYRNYYRMVEQDTIEALIANINRKYNVDVVSMIKEDLKQE